MTNKVVSLDNKKIGIEVRHHGEAITLVPEQIVAGVLTKLKQLYSKETNPDLVIACPTYYSSVERQAILDACVIANVNCVRIISESTAIALSYGFFRKMELTDKPRYVAFVDFGHGKLTVTIASFVTQKLKILASISDRNLGARQMDQLLVEKFGGEFNEKYGCDPRKLPKQRLRLLDGIEKCRKILSANNETTLNIESLLEDEDICETLKRADFEDISVDILIRVKAVCQ